MLFTKEFYSVIDNFEKYAKQHVRTGSMGFEREPKENWKKQWYYSDGQANEAFKHFLVGYSLGKTA
jgi:hypothetical protein